MAVATCILHYLCSFHQFLPSFSIQLAETEPAAGLFLDQAEEEQQGVEVAPEGGVVVVDALDEMAGRCAVSFSRLPSCCVTCLASKSTMTTLNFQ